jgi:nitroreductase
MSPNVPEPPAFGAPCPLPAPSAETLALLARRRSCSPSTLKAPPPDQAQLADLLRLAARVPDHGKLNPWRFVIVQGDAKTELARRLEPLAGEQADPAKAAAVLGKLRDPPLAVIVVSRPVPAKIREWEQVLSAGAACTTLVIAANAMGFGANWITDWYSYDERGRTVMGLLPGEQVAGVVLLGTPSEAPLERVRADVPVLTTVWAPPA